MNGAYEGEPPVHQETAGRDPDMKRKGALSRKALEKALEEKRHEIACVHKLLEETMHSAEKRVRTLSRKALGNAVEEKRREIACVHKLLKETIRSAEEFNGRSDFEIVLRDLRGISEELRTKIEELRNLYTQDKNNYLGDEEPLLTSESLTLDQAYKLVEEIKSRQSDKLLETRSRLSYQSNRSKISSRSRASTAGSTAKMKALAEAAAARESAEFERRIAEKEHERRKREAEIERTREQERANHEKEMAFLAAERKIAVADAKLKAIEQATDEEDTGDKIEIAGIPNSKSEERTSTWLNSMTPETPQPGADMTKQQSPFEVKIPEKLPAKSRAAVSQPENNDGNVQITHQAFGRSLTTSTPINITGSQLVETLTSVNEQIVAGLARQNLPKCHPDTFSGDPTLFHPWKAAFKAMISDTNVSPVQEVNYLRRFTGGEAQKLVDNYRKRKQRDPNRLLDSLWAELERRFGSAAAITRVLLERMDKTAAFNDGENEKLQEFADLCADVESQMSYLPGLACLNFPIAIQPIGERLPVSLRHKWEKEITKHSEKNGGEYPGFHVFSKVVRDQARIKNNPNVLAASKRTTTTPAFSNRKDKEKSSRVLKTEAQPPTMQPDPPPKKEGEKMKRCPFHDLNGHTLEECLAFRSKSLEERTEWLRAAGLCYRCLSKGHTARSCKESIECSICKDRRHPALLHRETTRFPTQSGEAVDSKCTSTCNAMDGGVSCSKLLLVEVSSKEKPHTVHRVYAIMDEQSNSSLISTELADELGASGPEERYFLTTCSGTKETKYGRRVTDVVIQSISGAMANLPTLIECGNIPQDKREIPTPEMARRFPHLQEIANEIPPLDETANIHLLIGRDAPELLKVREFRNGPKGTPWAQRLSLGWTIIGQMCLDLAGGPTHVLVRRTNLVPANFINSRRRIVEPQYYEFVPCPNQLRVKESFTERDRGTEGDVFRTTREDNDVSLSCEDRKFLEIMEASIHKNDHGNWEMPLPFRHEDVKMPNNRSQAVNRLNGLIRTLRRKPQMEKDYIEFMQKILDKGHASPVPLEDIRKESQSGKVWYLPHFGVYHPKKPTQIRVVFDSSAEYSDVSLNKELLPGPDLMNSLLGVLIRFRRETTAIMCDIEQMFHSFHVDPNHRDFLRFLWFKDNKPGNPIAEYRMNVHLFGNGPSPAVATFGLRRTATDGEEEFGENAMKFVHRNFYVDDGLASTPTAKQAIALVTATQAMLRTANLRLHKIVSNSIEVMEAFPVEDRGKGVRDLDLRCDSLPAQRSLGVFWDLKNDNFTFQVTLPDKPFTRRGVLSTVNSIYDPLGLAVPVLLEGRLLLQKLVAMGKSKNKDKPLGWDDPLPDALLTQWQRWRNSLADLEKVSVPRCYHPVGFGTIVRREIHAFSDASEDAIGAAVYLRQVNDRGENHTALVFGQSRVAPIQITSIPRLELCAAVLASQAVDKIMKEMDVEIDEATFYTDSKVVLGYIQNESRRFYVYVANRVQLIRKISSPEQWTYVDTNENPADLATRPVNARNLAESEWLTGPKFLRTTSSPRKERLEIPLQASDPEVRKEVVAFTTRSSQHRGLGAERFSRFSSLHSLQRAIANLIVLVKEFKRRQNGVRESKGRGSGSANNASRLRNPTARELQQAITVIIRTAQRDSFGPELSPTLHSGTEPLKASRRENSEKKRVPKGSLPYQLDPFVDSDGVVRVGGRLRQAQLEYGEKHPALLSKNHHVGNLVVRHYHNQVHHQGRQITHGAIRQAGYWLIGGHRTVARELSKCVVCKKLRGPLLDQRMADLPADRSEVAPPFTNVGFDVFGPWMVRSRKTRGGAANSKRWGVVFTCLSSRAVHVEVLESMDTSSFICALRRFFAIRGTASLLRCDRGTNFTGAKAELDKALAELDQHKVERYAHKQGCEWLFNPPHASHFGGAWERQIGTIRRVLDAMFAELGSAQLTHELLVTLMAEVTAIVNARPIALVPTDVDEPQPLSPSMLLTMKTRPAGTSPGVFVPTDLYARRRWRRVQYLADQFWLRWRREYLQSMQPRRKWSSPRQNLTDGDVVLMKEEGTHRNNWPIGRVMEAIQSEDGQVRKARVEINRDGKKKAFLRPVKELVVLVPAGAGDRQPSS